MCTARDSFLDLEARLLMKFKKFCITESGSKGEGRKGKERKQERKREKEERGNEMRNEGRAKKIGKKDHNGQTAGSGSQS